MPLIRQEDTTEPMGQSEKAKAPWDIFVVDSDPITRQELKIVIRGCGYSARSFSDGLTALEELRRTKPKLVVVELLLPGMDGFELCQSIRTGLNYRELPLLCMSSLAWGSLSLPDLLHRRFKAKFLKKNLLATEFVQTITELLGADDQNSEKMASHRSQQNLRIGSAEALRVERFTQEFERTAARAQVRTTRNHVRVEREFRVEFGNLDEFVTEYSQNISAGGLFIRSFDPPELDEIIDVRISIPDLERTVSSRAVVVHHINPVQAEARGGSPGFGVQFMDVGQETREVLEELVQKAFVAQATQEAAKSSEPPMGWVVLVGLKRNTLLNQPSFLQRDDIQVIDFSNMENAQNFFMSHRPKAVIISEEVLEQKATEALTAMNEFVPPQTYRVLVKKSKEDLSELKTSGLCDEILDSRLTNAELLLGLRNCFGLKMREDPRVGHRALVEISMPDKHIRTTMLNISCGGMLVNSAVELPVGSSLRVEFELPEAGLLASHGVVVRSKRDKKGRQWSVGLRFVKPTEECESGIRRFVQSNTNFRDFFGWMKQRCFE